jgi:hypothetical protein
VIPGDTLLVPMMGTGTRKIRVKLYRRQNGHHVAMSELANAPLSWTHVGYGRIERREIGKMCEIKVEELFDHPQLPL